MTHREQNYSPIDKEALSIVFTYKKFHQFMYSTHSIIGNNYKPLKHILKKNTTFQQWHSILKCTLLLSKVLGSALSICLSFSIINFPIFYFRSADFFVGLPAVCLMHLYMFWMLPISKDYWMLSDNWSQ